MRIDIAALAIGTVEAQWWDWTESATGCSCFWNQALGNQVIKLIYFLSNKHYLPRWQVANVKTILNIIFESHFKSEIAEDLENLTW